jgi:hypothetical protein
MCTLIIDGADADNVVKSNANWGDLASHISRLPSSSHLGSSMFGFMGSTSTRT